MKRLSAMILALITLFSLCTITGCAGPISDQQAIEILTPLLEKDVVLNQYVWGSGFSTREDPGGDIGVTTICKYHRVNEDAPYHSTAALRADIEEVYSTLLAAAICQYAFENTEDSMARFCDFIQDNKVGDLQIDVTLNHPPYELDAVMYPDTIHVKRSTTTIIEAEIEYSIGSDSARGTMIIRALLQDGKWKLDTHTWAGAIG